MSLKESHESAAQEQGLSLGTLLELVRRNARLAAIVTVAVMAASLVWLSGKPPVYRARATLILDSSNSKGGVLGDLAALTAAPQAASEMELLRARSTAEQTVLPATEGTSDERHLGLTTLVEDLGNRPLARLFGSNPSDDGSAESPRLSASIESRDPRAKLSHVRVAFTAPERVRIACGGWTRHLNPSAPDDLEATLVAGQPIDYCGLRLWLAPHGDLTGREFVVALSSAPDAVERVLRATRVTETERNSGVIEVTFDDSDARRAAETANALCKNYLDRDKRRGEKRASQTVDFIAQQLDGQIKALHEAENQVVELERKNPRAIDIGETGKALIAQLSQLEVERVQIRLMKVAVGQALALIQSGETEALSRLSVELVDPITAHYVEELAKLEAESVLQDRSDVGAYKTMLQGKALELESRRDALLIDLAAARSAHAAVTVGGAESVARLGSGATQIGDPLLTGYLEELSRLESARDALAGEFTPEHPDLASADKRIAALRERVLSLLGNRIEGLESQRAEFERLLASYADRTEAYPKDERARIASAADGLRKSTVTHLVSRLAGLDSRSESIGAEVTRVEAQLGDLPEDERVLADPMRRLEAHTEIVKFLLSRQQEAEITRAATLAGAEFIDPAVPPAVRFGPSIPLHLMLGTVLGLLLALGLAFVRESVGRRVFTSAELETATGLPVLGTVPDFRHGRFRIKGAGDNFVPMRDDPEGPCAEAYRSLRANLKFALAGDREIKTLAFTSCSPGEGKSITNVSLAIAFAMNDKRVLLVDADMRRPSVHRYLGLELSPGLSDILQSRLSWRECLRKDVAHGLDVITAGKSPSSPGDLLDSAACTRLFEELRGEYDLIVFDVPPALAVADIDNIAARLDAVLLLAKSNKISGPIVSAAANRLRQVGANLIGTVLNAVSASSGGTYGYGYGYGYGERQSKTRSGRLAG